MWPWVKSQIVPAVNIPIPTKIGSKMGGAPTPKWYHWFVLTHSQVFLWEPFFGVEGEPTGSQSLWAFRFAICENTEHIELMLVQTWAKNQRPPKVKGLAVGRSFVGVPAWPPPSGYK